MDIRLYSLHWRIRSAAIDEGLKAASGMLRELNLANVGTQSHSFEIRMVGGEKILRIEIHATRSR